MLSGDEASIMASTFLNKTMEKPALNQYWFSEETIKAIVDEVETEGNRVAFLSTPSVFFSMVDADPTVVQCSRLFDYDVSFASHPSFVFYDFNNPEELPDHLLHSFDYVIIDPPFITETVWRNYARTTELLWPPGGGKVLASTVIENAPLLRELFGAKPVNFRPSVPNLVYQYSFFTNYSSSGGPLNTLNSEVDSDDWQGSEDYRSRATGSSASLPLTQ
ncbi:unnamed protein product [Vitrella brassicaformis CCMP3155]|uniref:N(6)-adenine-specific DNA methyltransferase 2 n=1 Tax=Vitrella brassicaformis (strain CCMP3155) TaxID=1169540 RepID=A0A0G4FJW2_VITBC|nr:unnamed protein product [Vitrella brassicaformis CCMP3155]|mmetsp:Transcript_49625/g.124449  ORF Transcript_49625/g.124449 Transcript_49625/m.124449 type:complete len:219 (-) Transcript_49625:953-1609(-)|eukprot:CEM13679.1 unnamed protein product [Vitrella brassicaformis CCMP3155]